jgi:hypothetical protein
MTVSRRHFLQALAGGAAAATALTAAPAGATTLSVLDRPTLDTGVKMKGKIFACGKRGATDPSAKELRYASVATLIDLETHKISQNAIDVVAGHIPIALPDGRTVCNSHYDVDLVFMDPNLKVIKKHQAPKGYIYTGHPAVFPAIGVVAAPLARESADRADTVPEAYSVGPIQVFDINTMEPLDLVDSGGGAPHELIPAKNGTLCVGALAGYEQSVPGNWPLESRVAKNGICVLDAKTMKIKNVWDVQENVMIPHLAEGNDGHIYTMSAQFLPFLDRQPPNDRTGFTVTEADIERVDAYLQEIIGKPRDYPLSQLIYEDGRIAVPMGMHRFNPDTGKVDRIFTNAADFQRGQSVACNKETGRVFACYYHANRVIVVEPDGKKVRAIHGGDLQLYAVRGVTTIDNSPYVAVSGVYEGVAILDSRTLEVVRRYTVNLYRSTHVSYLPSV